MSRRYNPLLDWRHWCALLVMVICLNVALAFMQWPVLVRVLLGSVLLPPIGASLITRQFFITYGEWHGYPWPKWLVKR